MEGGMRELSEGDETILHSDWHAAYTGVYICQKSSNYIHLRYVFTEHIFYLNKKNVSGLSLLGAQAQSLVGELRSHMPQSMS